jgi:ribosome-associated translation inhibitor RaiA
MLKLRHGRHVWHGYLFSMNETPERTMTMDVQIRFRGVDSSEDLIEHATRRLHQQLSRFGRDVASVVLRISDENGPRGGRDKRCQLSVTGPRIGSLHLSELHEDVRAGLDLALGRLGHTIGRGIARARELGARALERSET